MALAGGIALHAGIEIFVPYQLDVAVSITVCIAQDLILPYILEIAILIFPFVHLTGGLRTAETSTQMRGWRH